MNPTLHNEFNLHYWNREVPHPAFPIYLGPDAIFARCYDAFRIQRVLDCLIQFPHTIVVETVCLGYLVHSCKVRSLLRLGESEEVLEDFR